MNAKKALSVFAAASMLATAATAYEAKAKVTMEGNIIKETKAKGADATYSLFNLDPITEKGDNGIIIDMDGEIVGAHFELFYDLVDGSKAEDGWALNARNTHLWFTPVDAVKIRLGYVGIDDFFVERIDEEKVANPFKLLERDDTAHPVYITNADVDEMGFSLAVMPVEGLTVSAAIAPGVGKAGYIKGDDPNDGKYSAWGATAKYEMDNGLTFEAAYRDNGKDSWKVARAGVGYADENVYAFFQPVLGFDYIAADDAIKMNGIAFDLYGEYILDEAWKFTAHLPVTVRTTGDDDDPNYMEALVKCEYNMGYVALLDDFTPYMLVETLNPVTLDDNMSDTLGLNIQPGVGFKVGDCEVDVGFSAQLNAKADTTTERFTWSVPFSVSVEF